MFHGHPSFTDSLGKLFSLEQISNPVIAASWCLSSWTCLGTRVQPAPWYQSELRAPRKCHCLSLGWLADLMWWRSYLFSSFPTSMLFSFSPFKWILSSIVEQREAFRRWCVFCHTELCFFVRLRTLFLVSYLGPLFLWLIHSLPNHHFSTDDSSK